MLECNWKRKIAVTLVFIALAFLWIPVLPLHAIETQGVYSEVLGDIVTVYVEPEHTVVTINSVFTVNVSVANIPSDGLFSYEFQLSYNNTVLEGVNVTLPEGHFLEPEDPDFIFVVQCHVNQTLGKVILAVTLCSGSEPVKMGNGTLVSATFKAKSFGYSILSIPEQYLILDRPACGPYEDVDVVEGLVEVVSPDLNMDGNVDLEDLDLQKKAFRSNPGYPNWDPLADLNKDKVVNILDISLVAKDYGKTV